MRQKQVIAIMLFAWLSAGGAVAQTQRIEGTWYFSFSAIPLGKLWFGLEETDTRYELHASFKTKGLVRMFKKIKTSAYSRGSLRDGVMRSELMQYASRKKDTQLRLAYAPDGTLIERLVVPEDDPNYRPRVPNAAVQNAYGYSDILYGLQAAILGKHWAQPTPLDFRLYDGKRLMRLTFNHVSSDVTHHRFALRRTLLDGFTQKEQNRHAKGEPPVYVDFRRTDGFPVYLEVELSYGTLRAKWEAKPSIQ